MAWGWVVRLASVSWEECEVGEVGETCGFEFWGLVRISFFASWGTSCVDSGDEVDVDIDASLVVSFSPFFCPLSSLCLRRLAPVFRLQFRARFSFLCAENSVLIANERSRLGFGDGSSPGLIRRAGFACVVHPVVRLQ